MLQGWAIVDNTVGEDWNNVELSLVAGAPQSFIQQLSQPYYARRPVIELPQSAQLTPQTHESAMLGGLGAVAGTVTDATGAFIPNAQVKLLDASGTLVGSKTTDGAGHYDFGDLPAANYRLEVSSPGFQTTVVNGLSLGGGSQVAQEVKLNVGAITNTVTVEASGLSTLNTSSAGVGESMSGAVGSGRELGSWIMESALAEFLVLPAGLVPAPVAAWVGVCTGGGSTKRRQPKGRSLAIFSSTS